MSRKARIWREDAEVTPWSGPAGAIQRWRYCVPSAGLIGFAWSWHSAMGAVCAELREQRLVEFQETVNRMASAVAESQALPSYLLVHPED